MHQKKFWIKEYIKRYEFISKFSYGQILDCKFNNFSSLHSADILLSNNADTIITYYNKTNEISRRTIKNGKIDFEYLDKFPINENSPELENLDEKKGGLLTGLDCIISFEATLNQMGLEKSIKKFSELLNENGKLFVSILNKNKIDHNNISEEFQHVIFSKDEFLQILRKYFENIELYSQILIKEEIESSVDKKIKFFRNIGSKILTSVDKNRSFYIDHVQKTMKKIDDKKNISSKMTDDSYIPTRNDETDQPYYFLAICKK